MTTIKQIQNHEKGMLKDISKVCDENGINYYLAGGTFLGAVRHKGFIPWDDDIDINLTMRDFHKLKKCCKTQLPGYYFWQDAWTDRNHHTVWAKLRDTKTVICEMTNTGKKKGEGVYLDIFPMVYAAKSKKVLDFQMKVIYSYSYCVKNQQKIKEMYSSSFLVKTFRIIRELIIYRCGGQFLYWLMLLLQNKNSKKLLVLDISFYDTYNEVSVSRAKRTMIHNEWLTPHYYEFCGEKLKSFSDYDSYMIDHFGDNYMTPIKQKERLHINLDNTIIPENN